MIGVFSYAGFFDEDLISYQSMKKKKLFFNKKRLTKKQKTRLYTVGFLSLNMLFLAGVAGFIAVFQAGSSSDGQQVIQHAVEETKVANPLDELSSVDIAVQVAQLARLEETTAVVNDADSRNTKLEIVTSDSQVVAKPHIVKTNSHSVNDVVEYVVVKGDTVSSLAEKFKISSNSIRWSNDISGNYIEAGTKLSIPPIDGFVYKFRVDDTPEKLATRYGTTKEKIIAFNDGEIDGFEVGDLLVIPDGSVPAPVTRSYTYAVSGFRYGQKAVYGHNGYAFGNCTWYAASRRRQLGRPVPSNLGNAWTWDDRARMAGLPVVTGVPVVGAVAVTDSYSNPGHVAVVEKVNKDGSVWISEMNYYGAAYSTTDLSKPARGGFNRISYRLLSTGEASRTPFVH